uniref:ATP synthase complex subunit 8 n=1 Tax=Mordella atrata TaxID=633874 RepID=C8YXE6_9CUCU|nr:ATP synthase F0 subunit 8 [Mordella atrata]ACO92580.1 ATP synthase F0 subunit 8 [Mordella atrata]
MPQMAPLNWLSLMILFLSIFILIMMLNYFSFQYKSKKSLITSSSHKINWKW